MSHIRQTLGSWRVALRLARRDMFVGKVRSLLVIIIVAAPIAGMGAMQIYQDTTHTDDMYRKQQIAAFGTSANAFITVMSDSAVEQTWDGSGGSSKANPNNGPRLSEADIRSMLPAGSTVVKTGLQISSVIEVGDRAIIAGVRPEDVRQEPLAGLWRMDAGRMPQTLHEVLLSRSSAAQLEAHIGTRVKVTAVGATAQTSTFEVVASAGDVVRRILQ